MTKSIRYKEIFRVWKNERKSTKLLEVKGSIYTKIRQRIENLQNELNQLEKDQVVSARIIKERIDRLQKILKDLTKIRGHKIIHAILDDNVPKEGLAIEEMEFIKELQTIFENHEKRCILGEMISETPKGKQGRDSNELYSQKEEEVVTVRILQDLPEIMDVRGTSEEKITYGPFKKEDIVQLPLIYAKTLIMKNAADKIDLPEL
ncbi:MAG: hypothetical protein U9O98_02130 [Asgard group archaeon]|nr:hypothetical protein [Asgard group archaeon]